jgi:hypothetical protein
MPPAAKRPPEVRILGIAGMLEVAAADDIVALGVAGSGRQLPRDAAKCLIRIRLA